MNHLPAAIMDRFDALEQVIKTVARDKRIYYVANPGNWGDGLIRHGTLRFFEERGIAVTEEIVRDLYASPWFRPNHRRSWLKRLRKRDWRSGPMKFAGVKKSQSVLVFGGGGAWCRFWDHRRPLAKLCRHFSATVVLPSTFEFEPVAPALTLFRRDRRESRRIVPSSHFCDDMAFYLGPRPAAPGSGPGYFFRTDAESAGRIALPEENRDLSHENDYLAPLDGFMNALAPFASIHTDRLHVAIAACLMEKELHLYPGGYFKNRAVFESSIADNFPNAYFHADATELQDAS
ncbi:MAG: polysaccharide pyruvyl transferase family protein [Proteobacteria bacterium]|nr:polysaccharide pyruvyl transferase family protein [Pseudomonadota bacterium]